MLYTPHKAGQGKGRMESGKQQHIEQNTLDLGNTREHWINSHAHFGILYGDPQKRGLLRVHPILLFGHLLRARLSNFGKGNALYHAVETVCKSKRFQT